MKRLMGGGGVPPSCELSLSNVYYHHNRCCSHVCMVKDISHQSPKLDMLWTHMKPFWDMTN